MPATHTCRTPGKNYNEKARNDKLVNKRPLEAIKGNQNVGMGVLKGCGKTQEAHEAAMITGDLKEIDKSDGFQKKKREREK